QDRPALAHRNVVGRIERKRTQRPKSPDLAAAIGRAECVTAILDEKEIVLLGKSGDRSQVKRIAERMRRHDRARPLASCCLELPHIDVVSSKLDIDENGYEAVLQQWIDGGRESGRAGDDLVARFERLVFQQMRC